MKSTKNSSSKISTKLPVNDDDLAQENYFSKFSPFLRIYYFPLIIYSETTKKMCQELNLVQSSRTLMDLLLKVDNLFLTLVINKIFSEFLAEIKLFSIVQTKNNLSTSFLSYL